MKRISLLGYSLMVMMLLAVSCTKEPEILTGSIYGEVTDAQTGEPIRGVQVSLTPGGMATTTGSDGAYEFLNLDVAQYQLQAQKTDYVTNTKRVSVVVGKSVSGDMVLTPVQKLELSAATLNFGKENTSLSFDIKNKGTSKFNWNISGLDHSDWIEVNPASGALDGGKSCTVQVTVLREKLTENKDLTLIVNADKESTSLKVNVEVEKKVAKIEVSPVTLDFGEDESVMTFNVKNVGNAGDVDWNVTGLDVDWARITPMEGTLGEGKTQAVKVTLLREALKEKSKTTVLINAVGESFPVEILAEASKNRYIAAEPAEVSFGTKREMNLVLVSYNGSTNYSLLLKEENIAWLEVSKTSGTIPQYDAANPGIREVVGLTVNRQDLPDGEYKCTLIVRSDLGDLEVPVSMVVEEESEPVVSSGSVSSCHEDLEFTLTSCKISGTTVTLEMMIENIGKSSHSLRLYGGSHSYAYDDQGYRYHEGYLTVAFSGGYYSSSSDYTDIPAGVKTKCTFKITDVDEKAALFSNISIDTNKDARLVLKNIPIEGKTAVGLPSSQTTGTVVSCRDNLEFILIDCKRGTNYTNLTLLVKNVGTSTETFRLYGGSHGYVYDELGNKYHEGYLTVAFSGGYYSSSSDYAYIPAEVTTWVYIRVANVDESATKFTNMTLDTGYDNYLVLKDVKIR